MDNVSITLDTIAQALAWIEYKDDFAGYIAEYEYQNDMLAAVQAYTACCNAYRELAAEKSSLIELAKHLNNL
jgi:hypothetical protein